jgi:hypothetical protein
MNRRAATVLSLRLSAAVLALTPLSCASVAPHAAAASQAPGSAGHASLAWLDGVYQVIADGTVIPGGGANSGSPELIQATATGRVPADKKASDIDPYSLCQPIGPFRMMAQPRLTMQLVAASGRLVVLFQDVQHGFLRSLYLHGTLPQHYVARYGWQGYSSAVWDGKALVVDTRGFDDRTWLNEHTRASDALHLVEHIIPRDGGRYLEYRMTATDPKSLAAPYGYVRYFRRVDQRIRQDICIPHTTWTLDDGL